MHGGFGAFGAVNAARANAGVYLDKRGPSLPMGPETSEGVVGHPGPELFHEGDHDDTPEPP